MSKEDRRQYDESLKAYRDTIVVMGGQYMKGHDEGVAEGEKKKSLSIARNLKTMGLSVEDIAKATGLTEDIITSL